jgi:rhamnulokinase
MTTHYVACDLGAESGRVILGTLQDGKISLEEIHRFPTGVFPVNGTMRWNIPGIFAELKAGVKKAAQKQSNIESISFDSWGVDYVLIREGEPMLGLPYHYRDARTDEAYPRVLDKAGRELIFNETGIQFMGINTLYHLDAHHKQQPEMLRLAGKFLLIADYFAWLFCGREAVEESNASTTQIYNPRSGNWSDALIEKLDLPQHIFPEIVPSGTPLGALREELAREVGLSPNVQVLATCSHDTGAAVAAVPAEGENWAYLSSGTWSLLGVELPAPVINEQVAAANFTNEIGYGHTTRFLKNIVGLWIVQECRRAWASEGHEYSYDELHHLAREAAGFRCFIRPDDARFVKPGEMPEKVQAFCRESGQAVPETPGQIIRCVLESLALLYVSTIETLEQLTGKTIDTLHIVGGGSQNTLLNEFAADATGRRVLAGPVEATAIGNIMLQAITLGQIPTLQAGRDAVRASFETQVFTPRDTSSWQAARERFKTLETL